MNYKKSAEILKKISLTERILINCHRNPDADSIGAALATAKVLGRLGKKVTIISPDEIIHDYKFLPGVDKILKVDFAKFKFGDFDLFIILDSAGPNMITGRDDKFKPGIPTICIDHHETNIDFADLTLNDPGKSSTGELLYRLFEDWGVGVDRDIATCLMAGIINDSGNFTYQSVTTETFDVAKRLMEKGANRALIVENLLRSVPLSTLKMVGMMIDRAELDRKFRFVWTAVSFNEAKALGEVAGARDIAANLIVQTKEADFCLIMVEKDRGVLSVSLRSRNSFDVSKIATALGGGGHKAAAGARISKVPYDSAVLKVLETARRIANEAKN